MKDLTEIAQIKPSWGGLARVALWTVAFIALAGHLVPKPVETPPFAAAAHGSDLRLTAANFEDPRFTIPLPKRDGLTIGWVTDSTGALFPPDRAIAVADYKDARLMPAMVLEKLKHKLNRDDIYVDLDIQLGMRSLESYSAVAAAIEARPGMIVLDINPIWSFSPWEPFKRHAALNRGAGLWAQHMTSWPWLFTIASPANLLWGTLGMQFPAIRDGSAIYAGLSMPEHTQLKLARAKLAPAKKDDGKVQISLGNIVFWMCFGTEADTCAKVANTGEKKGINNKLWYREMLKYAIYDGNSLSQAATHKSLEILRDSGIPTLVYLAPMAPDVKDDPEAETALAGIRAHLAALAEEYKGTNVHIVPQVPAGLVSQSDFRDDDGVHLVNPGGFPAYLADEISLILGQRGAGGEK